MREHPQEEAIHAVLAVLLPAVFILLLVLFGQLGNFGFTTPLDDELTEILLKE